MSGKLFGSFFEVSVSDCEKLYFDRVSPIVVSIASPLFAAAYSLRLLVPAETEMFRPAVIPLWKRSGMFSTLTSDFKDLLLDKAR